MIPILMSAFLIACFNKTEVSVAQVVRDTTILPPERYTQLNLDSIEVAQFISVDADDKNIALRIRNFYNSRNYQYAWFDEQGLTEHGEAFWNLHQLQISEDHDSSLSAKRLHHNMQMLLNEDTSGLKGKTLQTTELDLTLHFFKYINTAFATQVQPEQMQWHIPKRKVNAETMLDSFLTSKEGDWKPLNQAFYRLQNKLQQYAAIAKAGGWPLIKMKKGQLKEGVSDSIIGQVKKRLKISGDYNLDDTSALFTRQLVMVIKNMQRSYGLKETGIVNAALIKLLNVPIEERLKQMKINMERMRWMPAVGDGIFVNIPEYRLHVFEKNVEVLGMDIVVGKAANRTVIFSDKMEYIIFSPYWNVPPSIVRKEILPAMRRRSNYLSRNEMEITGYSSGLPVIRQKPGAQNALGGVKFVFPNRYNIYLHDTPAKTLFENEKRAFSHGCIRIQKPFEMAKYLLRDNNQWTDEKITAAMNRTSELWVKLPEAVPVYVVYFTSWVDREGMVHFREDVYGHDKRMADHLFRS